MTADCGQIYNCARTDVFCKAKTTADEVESSPIERTDVFLRSKKWPRTADKSYLFSRTDVFCEAKTTADEVESVREELKIGIFPNFKFQITF